MTDLSLFDTPDKILRAALKKEEEARDFYARLLPHCSVEFVTDLVEKLRDEESKHMRMVEQMITRLNLGHDVT